MTDAGYFRIKLVHMDPATRGGCFGGFSRVAGRLPIKTDPVLGGSKIVDLLPVGTFESGHGHLIQKVFPVAKKIILTQGLRKGTI